MKRLVTKVSLGVSLLFVTISLSSQTIGDELTGQQCLDKVEKYIETINSKLDGKETLQFETSKNKYSFQNIKADSWFQRELNVEITEKWSNVTFSLQIYITETEYWLMPGPGDKIEDLRELCQASIIELGLTKEGEFKGCSTKAMDYIDYIMDKIE